MAIAHISTTGFGSGATTGTINVTLPAAATTGRLIILAFRQLNVTTNPTYTVGSGFTVHATQTNTGGTAGKFAIAYKVAGGSDAGAVVTITSTASGGAFTFEGVCSIYSGTDTTTPVVATGAASLGSMSTTALTVGAVTMTQAASQLYVIGGGNLTTTTYTATLTNELYDGRFFTVGNFTQAVYDEAIAASGSTGTRSITASASVASWGTLAVGINPAAAATATLTQSTFRGRNDDGTETTATWKATAGTDWTQDVDTNFRIRFNVADSVAAATQNTAFVLRYSLNAGAYTAVSGASSVVRATASANVADGAATTEQLAGAGTFNAGTFDEVDGSALGFTAATSTGQDTEVEYCVQIRSADVVNADTVNLRVYAGSTALDAYTDTPVITVNEAAPPTTSLIWDPIGLLTRHLRSR